jgi:hypothetical protein
MVKVQATGEVHLICDKCLRWIKIQYAWPSYSVNQEAYRGGYFTINNKQIYNNQILDKHICPDCAKKPLKDLI